MLGERALDIPEHVQSYLHLHHILTLGTSSFTGVPHAATTAYVSDGSGLYFAMPPDELTLKNIEANHWASFTIDDYTPDFRKIRELRGVGRCGPVDDHFELDSIALLFAEKLPAVDRRELTNLRRIVPLVLDFIDLEYSAGVAVPRTTSFSVDAIDLPALVPQAISASLEQLVLAPGEVIVRQGERSERFFIVVSGDVEVRTEGHGQDVTVIRHGPGQLFGEIGALTGNPQAATFVALTPAVVLAIHRSAFQEVVAQSGRADIERRVHATANAIRQELPSAGWYVDPTDAAYRRYWDGETWTSQRAPLTGAHVSAVERSTTR